MTRAKIDERSFHYKPEPLNGAALVTGEDRRVGSGGERVGNEDVVGGRGRLPRINPRCAQLQ